MTAREKILSAIQSSELDCCSEQTTDVRSNMFVLSPDIPLEDVFAEAFSNVNGKFFFCQDEMEFIKNINTVFHSSGWNYVFCKDKKLQQLLINAGIPFSTGSEDFISMEAGVTGCEFLLARLGSIMVSSKQISGRQMNVFPPVHIIIATVSQLVPDLGDALKGIKDRYPDNLPSMISIITGPSRTADIEKTLILGAHGPKDVYVFLINRNFS